MISAPPVFVDAVYFIARTVRIDQWRPAADRALDAVGTRHMVTTEGVLSEFLAGVARYGPEIRTLAAYTIDQLRQDPNIEVVEQATILVSAGLEAYRGEFLHTRLSLEDCIAILVMRERGITEALTADREFLRAGITPLMAV